MRRRFPYNQQNKNENEKQKTNTDAGHKTQMLLIFQQFETAAWRISDDFSTSRTVCVLS